MLQAQTPARKQDTSNKYRIFVKKLLGVAQRRSLGKLVNKIKIDCREIGCEDNEETNIINSMSCFALTDF